MFSGPECITGLNLDLTYTSKLFNLKIQRIHKFLGTMPLPAGFPHVVTDADIAAMSIDAKVGPGWLVPTVRQSLVEPAIVDSKPVTYKVTPSKVDVFAAFDPDAVGVPNYVHARTRVKNGVFENLNNESDVIAAMKQGSYQALHYIDYTGEGWVGVDLPQLAASNLKTIPAYALVSPPDFFPSSGQFELSEWSRSNQVPPGFKKSLWSVDPTPLSDTRLPGNLQLPNSPFSAADSTITAVIGMGAPSGIAPIWPVQPDARRTTSLPDDAAGVFAPGWDVGTDKKSGAGGGEHLAGYALGSPFPEDAKLCAALSTFWPAVAPDVFRTFVRVIGFSNGTIAPLTDDEIGQSGSLSWDGVSGPKEITVNGQPFIEFPAFLNADYVRQAVENRFSLRPTASITVEEYALGDAARAAGVSSFGYGGTNGHVALRELSAERSVLVPLAAESRAELAHVAAGLGAQLASIQGDRALRGFSTVHGSGSVRTVVKARAPNTLACKLKALASEIGAQAATRPYRRPHVVFVFSGHGSQWLGMGRDLLASEPTFSRVLRRCDRLIQAEGGASVVAELCTHAQVSRLDRTEVIQPVLYALQVALARMLQSWGHHAERRTRTKHRRGRCRRDRGCAVRRVGGEADRALVFVGGAQGLRSGRDGGGRGQPDRGRSVAMQGKRSRHLPV